MIRDLLAGRYVPGNSVLHRSDPRTKILLAIVFMTLVFLADGYPSFLLLAVFILMVANRAGKPFRHSLRGIKAILSIALFTMAVNSLAVKGTPLCESGLLSFVSREGITLSVRVVLRLFLLMTGASLLTSTTTPISLMDGLEALMRPMGRLHVPVHEAAMMMAIALRFLPVLLDEAERIFKAQASRCAVFDSGNPLKRARNCVPVLVPLFAGAFKRADDLATAMESRCYQGSAGRSRMRRLAFSRADLACAAVMIPLSTTLVYIEYLM